MTSKRSFTIIQTEAVNERLLLGGVKMSDTKENILRTALSLFAQNGYEAVSVSMIAGVLGVTKGALYKHYKNKRDIFNSIVERMYQIDTERAKKYSVPQGTLDEMSEEYKNTEFNNIVQFALAQFDFWTTDVFASNFRKMLTLEQYKTPEMNTLYQDCIVSGPIKYLENLFSEMIKKGILKKIGAKQLAIEFYAPFFLLISTSDEFKNNDLNAKNKLTTHIQRFIENNKIDRK